MKLRLLAPTKQRGVLADWPPVSIWFGPPRRSRTGKPGTPQEKSRSSNKPFFNFREVTVSDFWRLSIASWFPVVSWICHPNQLSIIIDNQVQSCISTRERLDFVPHRSYFLKCLTGEAPLQLHLRIAAVGKDPWHLDRIQRVKVIFQNINDILENSCGNPSPSRCTNYQLNLLIFQYNCR